MDEQRRASRHRDGHVASLSMRPETTFPAPTERSSSSLSLMTHDAHSTASVGPRTPSSGKRRRDPEENETPLLFARENCLMSRALDSRTSRGGPEDILPGRSRPQRTLEMLNPGGGARTGRSGFTGPPTVRKARAESGAHHRPAHRERDDVLQAQDHNRGL